MPDRPVQLDAAARPDDRRVPPDEDRRLLERARRGDAEAFHALVDRHAQPLFRLAVSLVGQVADAEDVLQETFLAAFEGMRRFEGRSAVKTWLTRILCNQAARHHRRRLRRPATSAAAGGSTARPDPQAAHVARLDLPALLAVLPFEQRQVIVLREIEELSYQEIAATLDIPRGTVESRLHRARATLREKFADYLGR